MEEEKKETTEELCKLYLESLTPEEIQVYDLIQQDLKGVIFLHKSTGFLSWKQKRLEKKKMG